MEITLNQCEGDPDAYKGATSMRGRQGQVRGPGHLALCWQHPKPRDDSCSNRELTQMRAASDSP